MAAPIAPAPGDLKAILINNNAEATNSSVIDLILSAQGATEMLISNDEAFTGAAWEAFVTAKEWTLIDEEIGPRFGDGPKTVYVKFRNAALDETDIHAATIELDTVPPAVGAIPIIINNGELKVSNRNVVLTLDATGATSVEVFNEDQQAELSGEVFPYSATLSWTLSEGNGQKRVFVDFQDDIGNKTGFFSARVTLVGQEGQQPTITEPNEETPVLTDRFITVVGSGDPEATVELQINDLYGA